MTGSAGAIADLPRTRERAGPSVDSSLREYGRGIAGGLIFSLPIIYTMEVWWTGFIAQPSRLLVYLLGTFVLLLGYNRYAGLHHTASPKEVVIDSVEEMGLGLVIATLFLIILGRVSLDMHSAEIAGKIVMEGMTVAIGVSVGTAQLGGAGDEEDEDDSTPDPYQESTVLSIDQIVIAFCAAMLIGGNVAPTDEIPLIASEISSWSLLALVAISFLIGILILFYSEFHGARVGADEQTVVLVVAHGLATYAVALAAAAAALWFFGRFDDVSFIAGLSQTIVLGVATTLGASAGRLLMQ